MKPQKALHKYKADEKKTQNYRGHKYLQFPKVDGWYGYSDICVPGRSIDICSNAQRIIPSCADRTRALACKVLDLEIPSGRLIFEITVDGTPQFEIMNGILNRKAVCPDVRLNVHDFIPLGNEAMKTMFRYDAARSIADLLDLDWVEMIPHYGVSDQPEVWEHAAKQLMDKGYEGWIGKKLFAGYSEGKRNEDLLKIKEECTFDLLCIGFEKGKPDGKYRNTLGNLILQDKNGVKFKVSGMSDKQRHDWFNNAYLIVGKVVEIKAKNVMKDGSLREPRYKAIRFNKNIEDIDVVK